MKILHTVFFIIIFGVVNIWGQKYDFCIAPQKENVLMGGISNPIKVVVPGVDFSRITASISNGVIEKNDSIFIAKKVREQVVYLSIFVDGNIYQIDTFRIINFSYGACYFPGMSNGKIKKSILSDNKMKMQISNPQGIAGDFKVVGFTMSACWPGLDEEFTCYGDTLNLQQKAMIRQMENGHKVFFERILIQTPFNETITVRSFALRVVD